MNIQESDIGIGDYTSRIVKESNSRKYRFNTMKKSKKFMKNEMNKAQEIKESYSLE